MVRLGYLVDARIRYNKLELLIGVPNRGGWYNYILNHPEQIKTVCRGFNLPFTGLQNIEIMNILQTITRNKPAVFSVFKRDTYKRPGIKFRYFGNIKNFPLDRAAITWDKKQLSAELTPTMAHDVIKMFHFDELIDGAKPYKKREDIPVGYLPICAFNKIPEIKLALETLFKNGQCYQQRNIVIEFLKPSINEIKTVEDQLQTAREIAGIETEIRIVSEDF